MTFGSDDEDEDGALPDDFDGGVDSDSDSDESNSDSISNLKTKKKKITASNMEAQSRKLDARAKRDAELDLGINQGEDSDDNDEQMDEDDKGGVGEVITFDLPTAEEREVEAKSGGPDLHEVQRRIQDCVRVLSDFKALAAKNRFVLLFR